MKIKHPVFEARDAGIAQWYAVINGGFYYWGVISKCWNKSINEPGRNERELQAAMDEGRVYLVELRGTIL